MNTSKAIISIRPRAIIAALIVLSLLFLAPSCSKEEEAPKDINQM